MHFCFYKARNNGRTLLVVVMSPNPTGKEEQGKEKTEFVFACIGFALGYGNFGRSIDWLIDWLIHLFIQSLIRSFIGESSRRVYLSMTIIFFPGIGVAMIMVSFLVSIYYNVILAWTIKYSMRVGCHHAWNTGECHAANTNNANTVSPSKDFFA